MSGMWEKERPLVLVTGAAGRVGSTLRVGLGQDCRLRLVDRRPVAASSGVDVLTGELTDPGFTAAAMAGVDAVVHLAANPSPRADWASLYPTNIEATRLVYDCAADAGVGRVVFMSSAHATGLYDRDRMWPVDPGWPPRPCCFYGVTKACGEMLGSYHAESGELSVICLRLGSFQAQPRHERGLRTWISPRDCTDIVRRSLLTEHHFGIYYAVSANTRRPWKIDNAEVELGYKPQDDSERYVWRVDLTADSSPPCYQEHRGDGSLCVGLG